jgi:hypothetical protein
VGQDEGEHLDDEALLGHGVDTPGKHGVQHTPHRLHHPPGYGPSRLDAHFDVG